MRIPPRARRPAASSGAAANVAEFSLSRPLALYRGVRCGAESTLNLALSVRHFQSESARVAMRLNAGAAIVPPEPSGFGVPTPT